MTITVRLAKTSDSQAVAAVLLAAYNMANVSDAQATYLRELDMGHRYLVAEMKGVIAGITSWYLHGVPHHGLAELDRIAVLPEKRLNGAGSKLFYSLVTDAKLYYRQRGERLRKLFLLTHDDNEIAHALYRKVGMEKEVVLKDHYYDGRAEAVFSIFFPRTDL